MVAGVKVVSVLRRRSRKLNSVFSQSLASNTIRAPTFCFCQTQNCPQRDKWDMCHGLYRQISESPGFWFLKFGAVSPSRFLNES